MNTKTMSKPKTLVPKAIRNNADYQRAAAELDKLVLREDLSPDETNYLDVLTVLVEHYDAERYAPAGDERPVREKLRSLMESAGASQSDLVEVVGSKSMVSLLLSGDREPSKQTIKALAKYFRVSPAYFL